MDGVKKRYRYIIGVDEAGRGPLAGPLVVAGVLASARFDARILRGIKDSKQLTEKQRERWYAFLTTHPDLRFATAIISPGVIDTINILKAAHKGARRVYRALLTSMPQRIKAESRDSKKQKSSKINLAKATPVFAECHALLDGSLKLPHGVSYEVIIRGDEKIPIISAASVIAKVTRDRIMRTLHKKYPEYGFDEHKGYGTKKHMRAIRKFGPIGIHRKSFLSFLDA